MYLIIGCSRCEGIKIVKKESKNTLCNRCRKNINIKKARVFYRTESLEEAKKSRTVILSKDRPKKISKKEIVKEISEIQWEGFKNTEKDHIFKNTLDIQKPSKKSERELILTYLNEKREIRAKDLLEFAEKNGIDREKTKNMIDKLCNQGKVVKMKDGSLRLL